MRGICPALAGHDLFIIQQMESTMQKYIGTKLIRAEAMTRKEYSDFGCWDVPENEDGNDEGYMVEYLGGEPNTDDYDGYMTWEAKGEFERTYRPVDGLTFGLAIEAMRKGFRVAREGWNGKGMYLWLMPGNVVEDGSKLADPHLVRLFRETGKPIRFNDHIRMYCADGSITSGWIASQPDMTAEDWCIVA